MIFQIHLKLHCITLEKNRFLSLIATAKQPFQMQGLFGGAILTLHFPLILIPVNSIYPYHPRQTL